MLETQLTTLNKLRNELNKESCLPKDPFMKIGAGKASELNYNLPQSTSFTTYGDVPVDIPITAFKPAFSTEPENNYFDTVATLDAATLQQNIAQNIQLNNTNTPFVVNVNLLNKSLNSTKTKFQNISNVQTALQPKPNTTIPNNGTNPNSKVADNPTENTLPNEVPQQEAALYDQSTATNESQLTLLAQQGYMPVICEKFGGFDTRISLLKKPKKVIPRISIIEEYTTASYLGDFGAGKTVNVFSLLPSEKTTITIKTYKDITTTQSHTENILDSFSQNSADELEKLFEEESGTSDTTTSSVNNNANINTSFTAKIFKVAASTNAAYSRAKTKTATRTANTKSINRALSKHTNSSNASRNVTVNSNSIQSIKEGEETTNIRELTNINKSRVLNFVFRQLLQEYVSITYLSNIRIVFTNGYMESNRVIDLEDLNSLLEDIIEPAQVDIVKRDILKSYCKILNYKDIDIDFIEEKTVNYGECFGLKEVEKFWRRKQVTDSYTAGGLEIKVPGVILDVQKTILKTDSIIADAILGQGEALDCYGIKVQDAAAVGENLKNLELIQKLQAIEDIKDPVQKIELYKKIFGSCCEIAQTQIIH